MDNQIQKLQIKLRTLNSRKTFLYLVWKMHDCNFTFSAFSDCHTKGWSNCWVSLSNLFQVGKKNVSCIVSKTSEAIVQIILQDYQSPPETEEQRKNVTQEFGDLWQFPHVVKTIDGKHVSIEAPANSGFCIIIIKEHLELFFWLYAMPNILLH